MRRAVGVVLAVVVLATAVARAGAAEPAKSVGILCPVNCSTSDVRVFREALATAGFAEGRGDVGFVYRAAEGDLDGLAHLADELVAAKVDVIYTTWGTAAGQAAKRATTSIPVVVGSAADLVAAGLVGSLNRPEANVTGISSLARELESKRLELLKEVMPGAAQVAVFRDAQNPYSMLAIRQQREAAEKLGITLVELQVREADDIDRAFAVMAERQIAALCLHTYVPILAGGDRIVRHAREQKVTAVYSLRDFVDAGGLMSYGASLDKNARRAAAQVAKILAGAKPSEIPVEQSTAVEMVVNLKTAKAQGLTIPPAILARADEVIE
jgi:putative ABC transport system substrate-binding protein